MCEGGKCCLSIVSICAAISIYILLGATAFFFLENEHYGDSSSSSSSPFSSRSSSSSQHLPKSMLHVAELESLRNVTVQRLWVLTLELNVFYESNWTNLAELELQKFQDELLRFIFTSQASLSNNYNNNNIDNSNEINNNNNNNNNNNGIIISPKSNKPNNNNKDIFYYNNENNSLHNFPAALLYSLTLITTIGYGSVSPKSMSGRILTVCYACVGIPLTLCYLATVGDYFARNIRKIYNGLTRNGRQQHGGHGQHGQFGNSGGGVPIPISLILLILYLCGGAGIFWWLEGWSFIDALFFCFASLATIGFGGMLDPHSKHISLLISSVYILLGMALISTVFNLVQDEIIRRRSSGRRGDRIIRGGGGGGGGPGNGAAGATNEKGLILMGNNHHDVINNTTHLDNINNSTPTKGEEYFVPKCMALTELFVPSQQSQSQQGSNHLIPLYASNHINSNSNSNIHLSSSNSYICATLPRQARSKTVTFEDEKVSKESPDVFK